jgi:hypothetical protein
MNSAKLLPRFMVDQINEHIQYIRYFYLIQARCHRFQLQSKANEVNLQLKLFHLSYESALPLC